MLDIESEAHRFCNLPAGKRCCSAEGHTHGKYDMPYEQCLASGKCPYLNKSEYIKVWSEIDNQQKDRKKKTTAKPKRKVCKCKK